MKTVQKNPWNIESIQDFSCLKCPECAFFTKKENYFEKHAIAKHPLSALFFDEKSFSEIKNKVKDSVQVDLNHINVDNLKIEPTEIDSENDPFDCCDTNTQQKEEEFLISSIQYDLSNFDNQPKKLKVKAIESSNSKPYVNNQLDIVDNIMEEKQKSDLLEAQIPEYNPKKRQRKQNIAQTTNDQWKVGGHSKGSLFGSDEESSLNQVNKPKKMLMESIDFDKSDNNYIDALDGTKKQKEENDILKTQVPFISENKPKKRERKQQISERNNFEEEKIEPIKTEIKLDTVECLPSLPPVASKIHQKYQYQCEECGEKFDGKNGKKNYKNHWKTKHSQSLPTSMTSEYLSKNEKGFRKQIESAYYKNDGKIHSCSLCDFQENNTSKFNNHLKLHKHYQCAGCENKFHGTSGKTLFKMHLEKTKSQKPCDGKYIMHCDLCSSRFEEENVFKTHISSEHEVMTNIYNCSLCDYQTQSLAYWNKHVKTVYECDNCGVTFHGDNAKRNLKCHLKTHQEKIPEPQKIKTVKQPRKVKPKISHECSQCEKSFPYLSYLNRHKKNIHALNMKLEK
jgi:hypothetical protein